MTQHIEVDPGLWEEFHRVVNMSSRELLDWLRIRSAGEGTEALPDQAGSEVGRHVLQILQKRRVDLSAEDVATMRAVVDQVHAEHPDDDAGPRAGSTSWRHRLMTVGHDPLKAV